MTTEKLFTIQKAAAFLKVSEKTLRRWEQKGILVGVRTSGGHRRYTLDQLQYVKKHKKHLQAQFRSDTQSNKTHKIQESAFPLVQSSEQIAPHESINDLSEESKPIVVKYVHIPVITDKAREITSLENDENLREKVIPTFTPESVSTQTIIKNIYKSSPKVNRISLKIYAYAFACLLVLTVCAYIFRYIESTGIIGKFAGNITENQLSSNRNSTTSLSKEVAQVLAATDFSSLKFKINVPGEFTQDIAVNGGDISSSSDTFTIVNSGVTTIQIGGEASSITIGSTEGTTIINNSLDVNGSTNDIAGTLNLSGNSLTSTGDLAIDPGGGGVIIGGGTAGNVDLTGDDLLVSGDLEVNGIAYLPTLSIGGDTFTDLTGTGLSVQGGVLNTTIGTSIESAEITDGTIAAIDLNSSNSPTNAYALTYNSSTGGFTWTDLSSAVSGTGWTDSGTVVSLNTSSDDVTIGSTTDFAKLGIDGDSDEIQLLVQGNAGQTSNLLTLEQSDGTDVFTVSNAGDITTSGSLTINSETFSDLTGNGLQVSSNALTIRTVTATDALSSTISNGSGLEVLSSGLTLLQGCSTGQVLKWNESNDSWECANDTGATAAVINVENNDIAVGTNVDTIDFSTDFTLSASPSNEDNISIADDALNFSEFSDSLVLDASTSIGFGAGALNLTFTNNGSGDEIHNLSSTGDFLIQDGGTAFATFSDIGGITFDPTTTADITFTTDGASGSNFSITGLASGTGSALCLDGSNNLVTCTTGAGGLAGSGTAGQIAFFDTASSVSSETSGFKWDSTNDKLGIGIDSPLAKLHLTGAAAGKPLAIFNETGDQDIFDASASGTTVARITNAGNFLITGTLGTVTGNLTIDSQGTTTLSDNTTVSGTLTLSSLGAGATDTVLTHSSGVVQTRTIDSRVWGSSLVDGSGSANQVTYWSDANTLTSEAALALSRGGTGSSLSDPNADRIMFWDDSAGAVDWLAAGSGLTISGTTITADDSSSTNELQNVFTTISSQSGSTTANTTTDTLTINGSGIASTAISGDTLTITATEADTLASVTGRGATTTTLVNLNGGIISQGAVVGKALVRLDETGDQNILTASASGTTVANLDRSGNLTIEGALSDLSGTTLNINDDVLVQGGDLTLGQNGTSGTLTLYNELGGTDRTTVFQNSGSQTQNVTYTLPVDDGSSNYVLVTDGSGLLSWQDVTAVGGAGDITAVGNITSGAAFTSGVPGSELYFADNGFLGLGSGVGRIEFDDQALDEVNIVSAKLGVGTSTPDSLFQVDGAITGKALVTFNETGNQDILTASQAGTTVAKITNGGNLLLTGTLGTVTGNLTIDSQGTTTLSDNTTVSGTLTLNGLASGNTDTVLTLNASNIAASRSIDTRVWGSTLVDGSGSSNQVAYWSDSNTLTSEAALALSRGGTGASLSDPNADRIFFWDDSAGSTDWLAAGSGLTITGTTITADDSSATNELQNVFVTFSSQSGSTTANTTTDTLTINGSGIASTAVSGDTLTVTATEADTLASVTGRGATTTTLVNLNGGITSTGAIAGKALVRLDETGDQNILSASASGTNVFNLTRTGSLQLAANTSITTLASGTLTIGSSNLTALTITTDGSGDAEVVLPTGSISSTEVLDDTLTASDLNATLTFSDADYLNLSGVTQSNGVNEGFRLPTLDNTSNLPVNTGFIAYNTSNNKPYYYNGSAWTDFSGSTSSFTLTGDGSGSNQTINDGDTLTIAAGTGIDTTPSATDTLTVAFDSTELNDLTWGNNSDASILWTFDQSTGTDPTLAFANDQITATAATLTVSGDIDMADDNWIGLASNAGNIEFDDQTVDEVNVLNAKLGLGTSTPDSLLHVTGAITGKALVTFNETGNQDILTASQAGTTVARITNAGNFLLTGTLGTVTGDLTIDSQGTTTLSDNTIVSGTLTLNGLASGNTDTVLTLNASNVAASRSIDTRVWGSSLLDGAGATNRVAFYSDADTLSSNANFYWDNSAEKLGLGLTPVSKFDVSGTVVGKALVSLNDNGSDQNILTASASGTTVANLDRSGNLTIEGAIADLSGATLNINDDVLVQGGDLTLGQNGTDGTLTIYNELGGTDRTVVFQTSGSQSQDITYTLPVDDGSGNYVLTTDGNGLLSWQSVTGVGAGTGDITAVGNIASGDAFTSGTPGSELYFTDNGFLGLGNSVGRIEFDDQTVDEINVLSAKLGLGTATPTSLLHVTGTIDGKALAIFDETGGDQNILTASASGTTVANLDRSGNLTVEGAIADLSGSTLNINDDALIQGGDLTLGQNGTDGTLTLYNELGGTDRTVVFQTSASQTQDTTYTLPVDDGDSNYVLTTNGSGVLSWQSVTGGVGAGDISAVGNITTGDAFTSGTPGSELYFADNGFLGLGTSSGRIEFDDQTVDEVNILSAKLGLGTSTPTSLFHIDGTVTGKALTILNDTGSDQNILTASASGTTVANLDRSGNLTIEGAIADLSGTTLLVNDNLDVNGTTGVTVSGNDADLTFSGTGNHDITASAGTLRFGAATLTGQISAGTQTITNLGTADFGTGNVSITSTTIGLTTDTDLLSLVANALTVNGSVTATTTLSAQGTSIGLNNDASANNVISFGTGPGAATDDLYWGNSKICESSDTSCGWITATANNDYWQLNSNVLAPGGEASVTDRLVLGGNTSTSYQFEVNGRQTGKALVALTETGDQDILTASSSGTTTVFNLSRNGLVQTADLTLGLNDTSATISTQDTNEDLTIDPNGNGNIILTASTGLNITNAGLITDIDGTAISFDDDLSFVGPQSILTTTGDLTLSPADEVVFADTVTLIAGGHAGNVAYNVFANSGESPEQAGIDADNDLYIGDSLEVDGTIYQGDNQVCDTSGNCAGTTNYWDINSTDVSPGNAANDDAEVVIGGNETTLFQFEVNGAQVGKALVALNDTSSDQNILTASASGTTVANLDRSGNLTIEGSIADLSGATLLVNDNLDVNGTTGLTLSGSGADLIFANAERITNDTNGQFNFGRNDTGTVTLTANDDDATADLTILPGGAAGLTLGGASMTALTVTTDSTGDAEVVLPNDSIGTSEILDNTVTATDLAATLTFIDADYLNLAGITQSNGVNEGLRLPTLDNTSNLPANSGFIAYNTSNNKPYYYNGSAWTDFSGSTSSFTLTGSDTGTPQTINDGDTMTIAAGTGIDTTASNTDTLTVAFDSTELNDLTWGNNSDASILWTFDQSTGTDPTLAFANDQITATAATLTVSGDIDMADDNWIGLSSGAANIEFDDQTVDEVNVVNAKLGVGTSTPTSYLHISNSGLPVIGKAVAIFDQYESQDILTASAAGTSRLTVTNAGNLQFHQASSLTTTTGNLTIDSAGTFVISDATDLNNTLAVGGDITFDATTPTIALNNAETLLVTDGTNTLLSVADNGSAGTVSLINGGLFDLSAINNDASGEGLKLPQNVLASFASPGSAGFIAYDTTNNRPVYYNGSNWTDFSGSSTTFQDSYNNDGNGGDVLVTYTANDDSIVFTNPSSSGTDSSFVFQLNQDNTTANITGLSVTSAGLGSMINVDGASGGKAAVIINQTSSTQDIIAASQAGTARLTLSNSGNLQTGDLTLGLNDASATISTADTNEDLTIDPNGSGNIILTASSGLNIDSSGVITDLDGNVSIDDDLTFVGPQSITTTSGDLTINSAGTLQVSDAADFASTVAIGGDITFDATTPTIAINNTETLALTDGSNTLLTFADNGTSATVAFGGSTGFLDLSSITHATTAISGLKLPQSDLASNGPSAGDGFLAFDTGDNQVKVWYSGSWNSISGASTTFQQSYDNDANGSDVLVQLSSTDDSIRFFNPASSGTDSAYVFQLDQLNTTSAIDSLYVTGSGLGSLINASGASGGKAAVIINNTSTTQDLLTASSSGTTKFRIDTNGSIVSAASSGTGLSFTNTGITTDLSLQNGETIDNNVDGTISMNPTTFTLSGTTTLTASSLATLTTAATLSMASTTTLNCEDCIDFDDMKDAMALDAATAIAQTGFDLNLTGNGKLGVGLASSANNGKFQVSNSGQTAIGKALAIFDQYESQDILTASAAGTTIMTLGQTGNLSLTDSGSSNVNINLSSTGDFTIQDAGTTFASFRDDSIFELTFPATGKLSVNAAATDTTLNGANTGVIDLAIDAGSTAAGAIQQGFYMDFEALDDSNADQIFRAMKIDFTNSSEDAGDTTYAFSLVNTNNTSGTAVATDALINLNNNDTTASSLANGLLITSTGVNGGIDDAIDVNDANITNAINMGSNFALFDSIRVFEGSTGTLTFEDTGGNDLMTIVDAGTTGNGTITGTFSVQGNTLGLNNDANANNLIAISGSQAGGSAGSDLYWGDKLLCTAASTNCGWASGTNYFTKNTTTITPATLSDRLLLTDGATTDTSNFRFEVNGKQVGKALVALTETGDQNILTASSSGTNTVFNLTRTGAIQADSVFSFGDTTPDGAAYNEIGTGNASHTAAGEVEDGSDLFVTDDIELDGTLFADGAATVTGTLTASGTFDSNGDVTIADTNIAFDGASTTFTTTGAFTLTPGGAMVFGDGGDSFAVDTTEFDIAAGTGAITIDDSGNLGSLTVEGTVLDINSLDFTAAGLITSGSNSSLTLTPAGSGDTILTTDDDSDIHTPNTTLTSDGSALLDLNLTLGDDTDADVVSAIRIDAISAATGDADQLYGININNLTTVSAVVEETAIRVGEDWQNILEIEGTTADGNEIFLVSEDATTDQTITIPNASGTICISGQTCATSGAVGYLTRNTTTLTPSTLSDRLLLTDGATTDTSNFRFEVNGKQTGKALVALTETGDQNIITASSSATNTVFNLSRAGLIQSADLTLGLNDASATISTQDSNEDLTIDPNGSGNIILTATTGLNIDSSGVLTDIDGAVSVDDDLSFVGAQQITTTSGNLTIDSAGTFVISDATDLNNTLALGGDLTFDATTPNIAINNTETLTITDGSNNLLTLADNGSAGTLTLTGSTAFLDLSQITHVTTAISGLKLPQSDLASNGPSAGDGFLAFDTGDNSVKVWYGGAWNSISGASTTLQQSYDNDANGSNVSIQLSAADDGITIFNPSSSGNDLSSYVLNLDQQNTTANIDTLQINGSGLGSLINASGASGGKAAFILNQTSTTQDIFAASASGTTQMTLSNAGVLSLIGGQTADITSLANGNITLSAAGTGDLRLLSDADTDILLPYTDFTSQDNSVLYTGASGKLSAATTTSSGLCLLSNGADAAPSWSTCPGGGTNYWQMNSGAISPFSDTLDVLVGATATSSAKVRMAGSLTGGQAALIVNQTENQDIFAASASGTSRLTLTNAGNLQFHQASSITTTTGDLTFDSAGDNIITSDILNVGSTAQNYNYFSNGAPSGVDIADGAGDLFIGDELEVNGIARFDTDVVFALSSTENIGITSTSLQLAGAPLQLTVTMAAGSSQDSQAMSTTITNTNNSNAQTVIGNRIIFDNDGTSTDDTTYGLQIQQSNSATADLDAGLYIDNADTAQLIGDAILIQSSGNGAITTGIDFDDTDIVTDIELQNGETIDNNTDNQINLGLGTSGTLLLTSTTTASLTNSAGALAINAQATGLNLQADGSIDVNIAGGSGATGCTVANATGNLTCSGNITGGTTGTVGYWTRGSNVLYPGTIADRIGVGTQTAGDISSSLYVTHDLASGATGKSLAVLNQTENQDILTASSGGTTRFILGNNGAIAATSSATTTAANTFTANSLTSGNLMSLLSSSTALTSGSMFSSSLTGAVAFTGNLNYFDWTPGSSTTATGDLFRIHIGPNGNVANLFNIVDDTSSLFSVTETQITSALPHQFTAAGDVSMAYDLQFTNQTASYIKSNASLEIDAGEPFESGNLTLKAYNQGDIVFDTGPGGNVIVGASGSGSLKFHVHDVQISTASAMIENSDTGINADGLAVKLGFTGNSNSGNAFITFLNGNGLVLGKIRGNGANDVNYQSNGVDMAEYFTKNDNYISQPGDIIVTDPGTQKVTASWAEYQSGTVGVVSSAPGFTGGEEGANKALVGLVGQVPVKIAASSQTITAGDYITTSNEKGRGMKATNNGRVIGQALENWTPGSGKDSIRIYLNNTWYQPNMLSLKTDGNIDEIKTAVIKPKEGTEDVAIQVGSTNSETGFGKLLVKNAEGQTVASVDEGGNATFSGTLAVNTIAPQSDVSGFGKLLVQGDTEVSGVLSAQTVEAENASVSGELAANVIRADRIISPDLMTREEIEALLTNTTTTNEALSSEAAGWPTNASGSASLNELSLENLFVTGTAAVNSLSAASSVTVGSDLVISASSDTQSATSIDTLNAPLSIQSSASQPLLFMAGLVQIDTSGNVTIAGNLDVAGKIESSGLNLKETTADAITGFGKILAVQDTNGKETAVITASGAAEFTQVKTDVLAVRADETATASATVAGAVFTNNATAGEAKLSAGTTSVTIKNNKVTEGSLIFVTATSQTASPLFVKGKDNGEFVVGSATPVTKETTFNWWIVEVQ